MIFLESYSEIWGAYRILSFCGAHYFLNIVVEANIVVWIYLMRKKGQVASILQNLIIMVKNQFERNVKIAHSDNVFEFKSSPML